MRSLPQHAPHETPPSRPLTRTQSASTATHGPLPARPDAAGPLPVSPRAHRDRPRPTELASLRPKKRANGGAHKHRHRPRTTKHPPSTDRAALSNAPQPIEHTAKHITSSHLPWGGRMTRREQPNPPAGSRSDVAALHHRCQAGLGERTPSRPRVSPTRFTQRDEKRKSEHRPPGAGHGCRLGLHEPLLEKSNPVAL
jgi:hypothetical protein